MNFKKIMIYIFLFILNLPLLSCSYSINPDIVHINDSCDLYIDEVHQATIKYDKHESQLIIEDGIDKILIIETITIKPTNTLTISENDFLLSLGYENYSDDNSRHSSSIKKNIEINGYDIFEMEIKEEITYSFCFIILNEVNGIEYNEIGSSMLIFNSYYLIK